MSIAYPKQIGLLTDGAFSPFMILSLLYGPGGTTTSQNWQLIVRRMGMTKKELYNEHDIIAGEVGDYDVEDLEEAD